MKFEKLLKEEYKKLGEAGPDTQPQNQPAPEDPNINPNQSKLPPPGEQAAEPLTPEGKVYLVDLARRALAFDPTQIGEFDKDVISDPITPENAEQKLKDIQRIVGTS